MVVADVPIYIAPTVNSVLGPPTAQPSTLGGLTVVTRCSSPVMIVLEVPSLIWLNEVLWFVMPKIPAWLVAFGAIAKQVTLLHLRRRTGWYCTFAGCRM